MKPLWIPLTLLALLVLLLALWQRFSPVSTAAAVVQRPHQRPADERAKLGSAIFLLPYYERALRAVDAQEWVKTDESLEQLQKVEAAPRINPILDAYLRILSRLARNFRELEKDLGATSKLLEENRLPEAKVHLDEAGAYLGEVERLMEPMKLAEQRLEGFFEVDLHRPAGLGTTYRLIILQERFRVLSSQLNLRYSLLGIFGLAPTQISLTLDKDRAFVGEEVRVSGSLQSPEGPLAGRTIGIQALVPRAVEGRINKTQLDIPVYREDISNLEQITLSTAITGSDGGFSTLIKLPGRYSIPSQRVFVVYSATGPDASNYQGTSASTEIRALFHETSLEMKVPPRAYVGQELVLTGTVASPLPPPGPRTVRVFLGERQIAEVQTLESFRVEMGKEGPLPLGTFPLTVAVDPQGLFSNALKEFPIEITPLDTRMQVQAPRWLLPFNPIKLQGKVSTQDGALQDAQVLVRLAGSEHLIRTSAEGEFQAILSAPLSPFAIGRQPVSIRVTPRGFVVPTGLFEHNLVVVSPSVFALPPALLLAALAFRRRGRRLLEVGVEMLTRPKKAPGGEVLMAALRPDLLPQGAPGRVLRAYVRALQRVEKRSTQAFITTMTLREFLHAVAPHLDGSLQPFRDLTGLAELALYSPLPLQEAQGERAETLAETVARGIS